MMSFAQSIEQESVNISKWDSQLMRGSQGENTFQQRTDSHPSSKRHDQNESYFKNNAIKKERP